MSAVRTPSSTELRNVLLFEELRKLLELLNLHSIEFLVLRGASLLERCYGDLGARVVGDVDLLVREPDQRRLIPILDAEGFQRKPQCGEAHFINPRWRSLEVDLHPDLWYASDPERPWKRSIPATIAGVSARVLCPEDELIYLSAYAVFHRVRLSEGTLRDIGQLVRTQPIDWESVRDEATRDHVSEAVILTLEAAGLPFGPLSGSRLRLWLWRRILRSEPPPRAGFLLRWLAIPGLSRKALAVLRHIFPSADFLRHRYGSDFPGGPFAARLWRPISLGLWGVRTTVRLGVRLLFRPRQ